MASRNVDLCPCVKYGLILTCYVNGKKRFRSLSYRAVEEYAVFNAAGATSHSPADSPLPAATPVTRRHAK